MKIPKIRIALCLCAAMIVILSLSLSVPAFASDDGCCVSDESKIVPPPETIENQTIAGESSNTDASTLLGKVISLLEEEALTPGGNLTLVDDILQNEGSIDPGEVRSKQFITVQSKNGSYFYIVIDRSGETENVYFLNLVDEADLLALMEDGDTAEAPIVTCTCKDKCFAGHVDTTCPVCAVNMTECTGKEAVKELPDQNNDPAAEEKQQRNQPEEKKSSSGAVLAVVMILALGGGAAYYYLKAGKNKPQTKGGADLDDYDFGEDAEMEFEAYEEAPAEAPESGEGTGEE